MLCGGLQNSLKNFPIEIDYPGINNRSNLVYDPLSKFVRITEIVGGSTASDKQLYWDRKDIVEERDAAGVVTKKFYDFGQQNGATSYYHQIDHLSSIRALTDSSSNTIASYSYSPFGLILKATELVESDFKFTGNYFHSRSNLNLTVRRAYNPEQGKFISRDPIAESGGVNLFAYVNNNPVSYIDPTGEMMGLPNPFKKNDDPCGECDDEYDACIERCKKFLHPVKRKKCFKDCADAYAKCLKGCC